MTINNAFYLMCLDLKTLTSLIIHMTSQLNPRKCDKNIHILAVILSKS